jgi:hypothetical protein
MPVLLFFSCSDSKCPIHKEKCYGVECPPLSAAIDWLFYVTEAMFVWAMDFKV